MSATLDSRVIRMIRWLLEQDRPRSTAALAADLGLSQRVVRYRLGAVEGYLRSQGAELQRRRGTGLLVDANEVDRARIRAELDGSTAAPRVYAPEEREQVVLANLLWAAPDATSIDALVEVLEVSKASARRDVQRVEPWLDRRGVPLVRRPGVGVGIVGGEIAIRQAMVQLLLEAVPDEVLGELCVREFNEAGLAQVRIPAGMREHLARLPIRTCWNIIQASQLSWTLAQGNGELVLCLYLAVSAARLLDGKAISMEAGQQRSLSDHPASDTAGNIAHAFANALDIALIEPEVAGITEYLLGLATLSSAVTLTESGEGSLVDQVLATASQALHPTLGEDPELRRGLLQHLERLAVRLRYGLPIHNPLLREVADRYPDVHDVSRQIGDVLAAELGAPIVEDEIGFITMYLAGAMERARLRPRRRALVVCPSGMATAWVLVSRLQAEFPELEVARVVAARRYEASLEDIDLVISTVPLTSEGTPLAVVHALLPAEDVRLIGSLMR